MNKFVVAAAVVCAVFVCAVAQEITPKPLSCPFHITISDASSGDFEVFGQNLDNDDGGVLKVVTGETYIYRCDIRDEEEDGCFVCEEGDCEYDFAIEAISDALDSHSVDLDIFGEFMYDDETYPEEDYDCPDGNTNCKLYCEDEALCIILDSKGRIVSYKDEDEDLDFTIAYHDTPSLSEFDVDGHSTPNLCGAVPSDSDSETSKHSGSISGNVIYPKKLDCAFHVTVVPGEEERKKRGTKKGRKGKKAGKKHGKKKLGKKKHGKKFGKKRSYGEVEEYYGLVNAEGQYLKIVVDPDDLYTLVRCDIKEEGKCYVKIYDAEEDPDEPCHDDYAEYNEFLPEILDYFVYNPDSTEKDIDCPDQINDNCVKYYSEDDEEYIIVDAKGYLVQATDGTVFTYHDDVPDVSIFEDIKCDNEPIDAPTNPCTPATSSSAASSSAKKSSSATGSTSTSHSTSTSAGSTTSTSGSASATNSTTSSESSAASTISNSSSSNYSPSSACTIKVAMAVVVAAILSALL